MRTVDEMTYELTRLLGSSHPDVRSRWWGTSGTGAGALPANQGACWFR